MEEETETAKRRGERTELKEMERKPENWAQDEKTARGTLHRHLGRNPLHVKYSIHALFLSPIFVMRFCNIQPLARVHLLGRKGLYVGVEGLERVTAVVTGHVP